MMPQDSQVEVSQPKIPSWSSPGTSDNVPNTRAWTFDTGWDEEQTGDVRDRDIFQAGRGLVGRGTYEIGA